MNEDHADAVAHYARVFGDAPATITASLQSFDAAAMILEVVTERGRQTLRIAFDHALRDADDARVTLIAMARHEAAAGRAAIPER